jgi:hypothetical protein
MALGPLTNELITNLEVSAVESFCDATVEQLQTGKQSQSALSLGAAVRARLPAKKEVEKDRHQIR